MKLYGKDYTTLWLDENTKDAIFVIDQRLLPFKFEILRLTTIKDVFVAVKDMIVRGAPLIGVAGGYGLYLGLLELGELNYKDKIQEQALYLKSSRPTAVNLQWAVDQVLDVILKSENYLSATENALKKANEIRNFEIDNCRLIGEHGVNLIEEISKLKSGQTVNILTHCNAGWLACIEYGTATAPIYKAFEKGIDIHVWVDETRPRNQGARLTAFELGQAGIKHTVIADNTGGHLMQHHLVDLVIVGSDRTSSNGDVANKIGTYLKALAAYDNQIPFYVALPISTIDFTLTDGIAQIPIEMRDENEVAYIEGWHKGEIISSRVIPEESHACNYGFDVTPARLVSGLITEKGIVKANRVEILKLK